MIYALTLNSLYENIINISTTYPVDRTPMPACISTLPLDWAALCAHVRRRWLPDHRGELPARRADVATLDAPVGVAACAQFGLRHHFASEQEAETWRCIGPRALTVCTRWHALRFDREEVRVAVVALRHCRTSGTTQQTEAARIDLRRHWTGYRRGMRAFGRQIDGVRQALMPRPRPTKTTAATPLIIAAE